MPRIPYADPSSITGPELRGYLELARQEGTPRPESQAIRAHNPNVIRAFSQAWDLTFRNGVCDQRWIKTLGIGHGEVLGDTTSGLAPGTVPRMP
jgi:hypothetical protein